MKRKEFIKKSATVIGGGIIAPYILPTGRLFARTGVEKAKHVVLVMFAGGVRQQESVLGRYLEDSQEVLGAVGNIMPNIFSGDAPTKKVVYGRDIPGEVKGTDPIPRLLTSPLSDQGLFFREVRAQSAGHYVGLNSLITGSTGTSQGLKVRPKSPTIFEYLRRHRGFSASECWFLGNSIGNSTPLLNSSDVSGYGLEYGANAFIPPVTFGAWGKNVLSNGKPYSQKDLEPMYEMKRFLDLGFTNEILQRTSIKNSDWESTKIKEFIRDTFIRQQLGQIASPPFASGSDATTAAYAAQVMKEFKPRITTLNLSEVDGCHSNFTGYLRALHRADHIVGWLWDYIQTQIPEMANETVIIVAPETGRNENPNPIVDENDWFAYDHSDANALRVWSVMAGKNIPKKIIGSEGNAIGRLTDIVPTIADIFGVYDQVMMSGYIDPLAQSQFLRV
jgi:hypothetical protein